MRSTTITRLAARGALAATVAGMFVGLAPAAYATTAEPVPASVAAPAALSNAPDTCKQGFVWREARSTDHVCVTPQTRQATWDENAAAARNREPNGGAYGPNTCKQGFVWREAFGGDVVCVTPDRRDQAKADNAQAAVRRATEPATKPKPGPKQCKYDGVGGGTRVNGSPPRFRNPDSPYVGARWDSCARTVTVYYGGATATHYNLRVNGQHVEMGGSLREKTFPDSQFREGNSTFAVQACNRESWGPFSSKSKCTPFSPDVRLGVHVGTVTQN